MATDGCILKAAKPIGARLFASHWVGTAGKGLPYCGSMVADCGFTATGSIRNPKSEIRNLAHQQFHAPLKNAPSARIDSTAAADQTSLLYLSLTRCCAAQTLRTIGPRGTTLEPIAPAPHRGDPGARDPKYESGEGFQPLRAARSSHSTSLRAGSGLVSQGRDALATSRLGFQ